MAVLRSILRGRVNSCLEISWPARASVLVQSHLYRSRSRSRHRHFGVSAVGFQFELLQMYVVFLRLGHCISQVFGRVRALMRL